MTMQTPHKRPTIDLTVVIPSKNEGANLNLLLPALQTALGGLPIHSEILVVDAASADGTPDIVASHGARYLREKGRGYGHAILTGAQAAHGNYIITMDADLSHPTRFIQDLWAARDQGDLVIASRYVAGGDADQPFFRLLLSKVLNAFFRFGLSLTVLDLTSGFRLYNRRVFDGLEIRFTSFVFLVELLLKIMRRGGHVAEVPFHYEPREEGQSNARIIHFGIDYCRLFYQMWRIRNACSFPDYSGRAC
ncbi:MAG: glycosyltransferase, partial [Candidatus Hydrogenedentes bacterium]|nr:glycosyltransferase [Candidatus Hydrogenedentota bacterium]